MCGKYTRGYDTPFPFFPRVAFDFLFVVVFFTFVLCFVLRVVLLVCVSSFLFVSPVLMCKDCLVTLSTRTPIQLA